MLHIKKNGLLPLIFHFFLFSYDLVNRCSAGYARRSQGTFIIIKDFSLWEVCVLLICEVSRVPFGTISLYVLHVTDCNVMRGGDKGKMSWRGSSPLVACIYTYSIYVIRHDHRWSRVGKSRKACWVVPRVPRILFFEFTSRGHVEPRVPFLVATVALPCFFNTLTLRSSEN